MKRKRLRAPVRRFDLDSVLLAAIVVAIAGVALAFIPSLNNSNRIKLALFEGLMIAAFLAFAFGRAFGQPIRLVRSPLYVPLLVYAGLIALSALIAPYKHHAVPELVRFYAAFALFVLVINVVTSRRRVASITTALALAAGLATAYGILQRLGLDPARWRSQDRLLSFFGNANFFAAFLIAVTPVFICRLLGSRQRAPAFAYGALSLVCVLCLVLTFTRAAWIGFGVAFVFMVAAVLGFSSLSARARRSVVIVVVALAAVAAIMGAAVPEARRRLVSAFRPQTGTAKARLVIWEGALKLSARKPILGSGLGQFRVLIPRTRDPRYLDYGVSFVTLHAHNEYLEVLAETGVVGLAAFLALLVLLFRHVLRATRETRDHALRLTAIGFLSGSLALLVSNAFSVNMRWPTGTFFFWLSAAMAVACARVERFERNPRHARSKRRPQETDGGRFVIELRRPALLGRRWVQTALVLIGVVVVGIVVHWHAQLLVSSTYLDRCTVALARGNLYGATRAAQRAIEINPHCYSAYYKLASSQNSQREYEAVLATYQRLEALWPHYARLDYNRGLALFNLGRYAEAADTLREAATRDASADVQTHLALMCLELDDPQGALDACDTALAADSRNVDALLGMARAYELLGDGEQALRSLQRAVEIGPRRPDAHLRLGRLLQTRKAYAQCIAAYGEALRVDPQSSAAYASLGNVYLEMGELDTAIGLLQRALSINAYDVLARLDLGVALQQQSRFDEAAREFRTVIQIDANPDAVQEAERRLREIGQTPSGD